MPDATPLDLVSLASLPIDSLGPLAALRANTEVLLTTRGSRAWVAWPRGLARIAASLLPVEGVRLYERSGDCWRPVGATLPDFEVPEDRDLDGPPLFRAILPAPFEAASPCANLPAPHGLRLVEDARERRATAVRCRPGELAAWADLAPTRRLAGLSAAWTAGEVVVRGEGLPEIAGAPRFWGGRLLVPLGSAAEPSLPEPALLRLLGAGPEAIVLVGDDGVEFIPGPAFGPVRRTGIRLAAGDDRP